MHPIVKVLQDKLPQGTQTHFRSAVTDEHLRVLGTNGSVFALGDANTIEQAKVRAGVGHLGRWAGAGVCWAVPWLAGWPARWLAGWGYRAGAGVPAPTHTHPPRPAKRRRRWRRRASCLTATPRRGPMGG